MSVSKTERRKGIGRALLKQLIQSARDRGISYLLAHTEPAWQDAVSFYARQGFTQYGADEIDIFMKLKIFE